MLILSSALRQDGESKAKEQVLTFCTCHSNDSFTFQKWYLPFIKKPETLFKERCEDYVDNSYKIYDLYFQRAL